MVTGSSTQYLGGTGYAQVGYGRFGTDVFPGTQGFKTFSQHVKCYVDVFYCGSGFLEPLTSTNVKTFFAPGPTTADVAYKTVFSGGDSKLHMYYGGTQLAESNFNPANVWVDSSWEGQFFGEAKHVKSDIVGRKNEKVFFSGLEKSNEPGINWVTLNNFSLVTPGADRYHSELTILGACCDFRIWTDPINSL